VGTPCVFDEKETASIRVSPVPYEGKCEARVKCGKDPRIQLEGLWTGRFVILRAVRHWSIWLEPHSSWPATCIVLPCTFGSCPFCNVEPDRIWLESEHAVAVADAFPVARGHTLVLPREHVMTISRLSIPEQKAI
jgi:HIT domain-containing protein